MPPESLNMKKHTLSNPPTFHLKTRAPISLFEQLARRAIEMEPTEKLLVGGTDCDE